MSGAGGLPTTAPKSFSWGFVQALCYGVRMDDQIIDAAMAKALQADTARTHALSGWLVMRDPPDYPGRFFSTS